MKDVNQHLEQAITGSPQIKPEERHKYLGQLKERLFLSATFADCKQNNFLQNLAQILQAKEATLYLNDKLPQHLQNEILQLAMQHNRPFTIVQKKEQPTDEQIALVYCDKQAVHIKACEYNIQFPTVSHSTHDDKLKEEKATLWQKLFHPHSK